MISNNCITNFIITSNNLLKITINMSSALVSNLTYLSDQRRVHSTPGRLPITSEYATPATKLNNERRCHVGLMHTVTLSEDGNHKGENPDGRRQTQIWKREGFFIHSVPNRKGLPYRTSSESVSAPIDNLFDARVVKIKYAGARAFVCRGHAQYVEICSCFRRSSASFDI